MRFEVSDARTNRSAGRTGSFTPAVSLCFVAGLLCSAGHVEGADRAVFTAWFGSVNRPAGSVPRQRMALAHLEAVRSDGSKVRRNLNTAADAVGENDVATITLVSTAEQVIVDYSLQMKSTFPL